MKKIKPGIYKHFKGMEYEVLDVATHSETEEELVIYRVLGEERLWARPFNMFLENVKIDGKQAPRFKYLR